MTIKDKPPMAPYTFSEYPKVVYGPDGSTKTIANAEACPDGFVGYDEHMGHVAESAEAAEAAVTAKAANKAERDGIKAFLDKHEVVYAKSLPTPKLRELSDQLTAHLAKES